MLPNRRMLDRDQEPNKDVRNYVKERYASAIQLMKNIEQRKQTILRVCRCIVERQGDFLEHGLDQLRPMMIKEIAEEIGIYERETQGTFSPITSIAAAVQAGVKFSNWFANSGSSTAPLNVALVDESQIFDGHLV